MRGAARPPRQELEEIVQNRTLLAAFVLGVVTCVLLAPASRAFPEIGYLQFAVDHNLETPDCLATGTCFIDFEAQGDPSAWLDQIRSASTLAILHWDRGIPWLVFDASPPDGVDRVAFYDARLDASTRIWLDAFEAHFDAIGRGYVAVSILSGERDRLAPLYVDPDTSVPFPATCPDFTPGTIVTVDPGTGPVSFDLERSYRHFVLYLAAKLSPDYLALLVEANLIEQQCAAQAPDLYALYRRLYDDVRSEVGSGPMMFATLGLLPLLDYTRSACYPTSGFGSCSSEPGPPAPDAGQAACFPLETGAIAELSMGGRLDVLALSFYPDALEMNPVPGSGASTDAYPLADWGTGASCATRLDWPDPVDPVAAIDRLGWTGPVAFAETSARACSTPMRFDVPDPPSPNPVELVLELPGTPALQAEWTSRTLAQAIRDDHLFYAHAFLRDYAPVGPWIVEQGVADPAIQRLINTWPCSGIQDASGTLKPEMAAVGLPEPGFATAAGLGALSIAMHRRRFPRRRSKGPRAAQAQRGAVQVGSIH